MSTETNESLSKTVNDLKEALRSSLGDKKEHRSAIDQIEKTIQSIESKLSNIDFAAEPIMAEASPAVQLTSV